MLFLHRCLQLGLSSGGCMRSLTLVCAAIALVACARTGANAQNLLANPGFEDFITMDGPPFVGSWEAFNGGAGAFASNSSFSPRSGAQHAILFINNVDNTFAGIFQDVLVSPGQPVEFSIWHKRV